MEHPRPNFAPKVFSILHKFRYISLKSICLTFVALYIISLIPLLWTGIYTTPYCDDYSYSIGTHEAWQTTHSLWHVLIAALRRTAGTYIVWQGTFSAAFLFTLQPSLFGEQYYVLVPWIILGSLTLSTWYFCHHLLRFIVPRIHKWLIWGISSIWLMMSTQLLPSIVEGFYWYNGAVFYTLFYSVSLILYGNIFNYLRVSDAMTPSQNKRRIWFLSMLSIFVGGGNYVTALLTAELAFVFTLYIYFIRKENKELLIPVGCFFLAFLLNIIAPGNAVRQSYFEKMSVIGAILRSFRSSWRMIILSLNALEWAGLLLSMPLLWNIGRTLRFRVRYPLLLSLFSYCLYASMYCPVFYATSYFLPGRMGNIVSYGYHFLLLFNILIWMAWIHQKIHGLSSADTATAPTRHEFPVVLLLASMLLCISQIFPHPTPLLECTSTWSTTASLLRGEAQQYHSEQLERLNALKSGASEVALKPLTTKPYALFLLELSTDSEESVNRALAKYYGVDKVYCLPESIDTE